MGKCFGYFAQRQRLPVLARKRCFDCTNDRMLAKLLDCRRRWEALRHVRNCRRGIVSRHRDIGTADQRVPLLVHPLACRAARLLVGLRSLSNRFASALAIRYRPHAISHIPSGSSKIARLTIRGRTDRPATRKRVQHGLSNSSNAGLAVGRRSTPNIEVARELDIIWSRLFRAPCK
jgi:hypothetical protein